MDFTTGLGVGTKGLNHMPDLVSKFGMSGKLIMLAFAVFWIVMLVNCLQRKFKVGTDKIAWIILLVFVPVIGAFVYLFWLYFVLKGKK